MLYCCHYLILILYCDANAESYVENIAAHRLGKSEDLSKIIVFLASEDADNFTGTDIEITGGKYAAQNVSTPGTGKRGKGNPIVEKPYLTVE